MRITYDPRQISYGALLQIFFSVAHDPTELNRQGPDVGPHYRSTIFPADARQAEVAKAYIDQLNAARAFDAPIVTTIEPDRPFYPAEDYHQDYLTLHPDQPYIVIHDLPKLAELKRLFPARYRADAGAGAGATGMSSGPPAVQSGGRDIVGVAAQEAGVKLLRYGQPGQEKPGLLDGQGRLRDLSGVIPDVAGDALLPASLDRLRASTPARCRWSRARPASDRASAASASSSASA